MSRFWMAVLSLLTFSSVAFAPGPRTLTLPRPMVIAGINLLEGDYKIWWNIRGPSGTVTFSRKGRTVATVHGVVSKSEKSVTRDTLFISRYPDGFIAITGFALAGSDQNITFLTTHSTRPRPPRFQVNAGMTEENLRASNHRGPMSLK